MEIIFILHLDKAAEGKVSLFVNRSVNICTEGGKKLNNIFTHIISMLPHCGCSFVTCKYFPLY